MISKAKDCAACGGIDAICKKARKNEAKTFGSLEKNQIKLDVTCPLVVRVADKLFYYSSYGKSGQ